MGRIIITALVSLMMSGCAIVTAVSGTAVEGLVYMFQGEEESFPASMRTMLVATQRGLQKTDLNVSVLEPIEDGYLMSFGNKNLDGKIGLKKQTNKLTTVSIKVKDGGMREESVERALIITIRKESERVKRSARFNFARYKNIREKKNVKSKQVGWYLPGKFLDVNEIWKSSWLRIKMPSGKTAYLKGSLAASTNK